MLNTKVSSYENAIIKEAKGVTTLKNFLESIKNEKYREKINHLRTKLDREAGKKYKKSFPNITVSGVFEGRRKEEHIKTYNYLICVDIDDLPDVNEAKNILQTDPFSSVVSLSASGRGVFVIIKLPHTKLKGWQQIRDYHIKYYYELEKYFKEKYGYTIDPHCKNVGRLRYISSDPLIYINNNARTFENGAVMPPEASETSTAVSNHTEAHTGPQKPSIRANILNNDTIEQVRSICGICEEKKILLGNDSYDNWLKLAFALSEAGKDGRKFFHQISSVSTKYNVDDCNKQYNIILKSPKWLDGITINTFFRYARDAGFDIKKDIPPEIRGFPIIHIKEVVYKPIEFQVESIWPVNSVGILSSPPGFCKSWFTWELAISIASGTPAFERFTCKKGRVLAFNAEDSPSMITKPRIEALCRNKGLQLNDLDLHLLDIPSILLNDIVAQRQLELTIQDYNPDILVFDPLRNVHSLDEDKATEMTAKLLHFLREINRTYNCSILLVCHDRKPSAFKHDRASQVRGSSALIGWRDVAIFFSKEDDDNLIKVTIYNRACEPAEPFLFELATTDDDEGNLKNARLVYTPSDLAESQHDLKDMAAIKNEVLQSPISQNMVIKKLKIGKKRGIELINQMLANKEIIKEGSFLYVPDDEPVFE